MDIRILLGRLRTAHLYLAVLGALLVSQPAVGATEPSAARHPLDPLSAEEMIAALSVLDADNKISPATRFPLIQLKEPPKADVLAWKPGDAVRREILVVAYERDAGKTYEAVVDLGQECVTAWRERQGVQPAIMEADVDIALDLVRADPRWQDAMRRRGVTDLEAIEIRALPAGYFGDPDEEGTRLLRCVSFLKGDASNFWARPIEGVVAHVDVRAGKILRFVDEGDVSVPQATADFDKGGTSGRPPPKPLEIRQPDGPGFTVEGQEVRWDRWRFRFALHPREGLVLYTVGYEDGGRVRPILYRASLSELMVVYGDPSAGWYWRTVLDQGENMLGWTAVSLAPNVDAPENARFFPSVFNEEDGTPESTPRAVALYERDGGILWKHAEPFGGNESRRARQLVLATVTTIGNYDYGFNWVFHQDGTLEQETLLTGIMTTKGVSRATDAMPEHGAESHGHLVMPQVEAVHHQHYFNFRLDLDVDGTENSIVELNSEAVPAGPENPYGNAFRMIETPLGTELAAKRQLDLATSRRWKVVNPATPNGLGQPTGFTLQPGENTMPLALPDSLIRKRGGFADAPVWITRAKPDELYAAGDYPNQSRGGDGLPAMIADDEPLERTDIVLWYTMGTTHIPRPEDWPVMPVHRMGFKLAPTGFFTQNPALDLPR